MNRCLTRASQLRAIVYDASGRPSVPTIDLAIDEPTIECGCQLDHARPRWDAPRHEVLVSWRDHA